MIKMMKNLQNLKNLTKHKMIAKMTKIKMMMNMMKMKKMINQKVKTGTGDGDLCLMKSLKTLHLIHT